jgi:hypothetical protein
VAVIGLIRALLRDDDTIVVRRLPAIKVLYAHTLGSAIAFLFMAVYLLFADLEISLLTTAFFLIWFALVTYITGILMVIQLVLLLVSYIILLIVDPDPLFWVAMFDCSKMYFTGYLFAGLLALLYNDLGFVFLMLAPWERKNLKIAFAVDSKKPMNIVKSPNEEEELTLLAQLDPKPLRYHVAQIRASIDNRTGHANTIAQTLLGLEGNFSSIDMERLKRLLDSDDFKAGVENLRNKLVAADPPSLDLVSQQIEPIAERYLKFKDEKLYNFNFRKLPKQPYTIALVANPYIMKRSNDGDVIPARPDPIMKDKRLFYKAVYKTLASFESDALLGRPGLFGRIRFVTVFKELGKRGILEEFPEELFDSSGDRIDHRLLQPTPDILEVVGNLIDENDPVQLSEIDLIWGISASPTRDRAYAQFADWQAVDESEGAQSIEIVCGIPYSFDPDPHDRKNDTIKPFPDLGIDDDLTQDAELFAASIHDFYSKIPGRAAINANSSSRYTMLHEFGHSMSSFYHGRIVDEYSDGFFLLETGATNGISYGFDINRIERNYEAVECGFIPVHKEFAEYNCNLYFSELDAPSAEEDWLGYFPERQAFEIYCTMDRSAAYSQFDPLVAAFIYERLAVKFCRAPLPEMLASPGWSVEQEPTDILAELELHFHVPSEGYTFSLQEENEESVKQKLLSLAGKSFSGSRKKESRIEPELKYASEKLELHTHILIRTAESSVKTLYDYDEFQSAFGDFKKQVRRDAPGICQMMLKRLPDV